MATRDKESRTPSQCKGPSRYGVSIIKMRRLRDRCVFLMGIPILGRHHPYYTPRFNEVERGVYWYHLVRLSVCPSVDRIVSALYLQQYSSDPFHICTSYQATSERVSRIMPISKFQHLKFWRIFKFCNCDFVSFWLGIQYDSMVWVIMRRRGYPQNAGVLVVLVMRQPVGSTNHTIGLFSSNIPNSASFGLIPFALFTFTL